jgi:hypothetical protein
MSENTDAVISNIHIHICKMQLSQLDIHIHICIRINIIRLLSAFTLLLNAVIIRYPHMR